MPLRPSVGLGIIRGRLKTNREFLKESNMPHRIEVSLKPSLPDPAGRRMSARIASDLGFVVDDLRVADEFIIDRNLKQ